MSDGISESRRRERAWQEVDRKHGGKCPHEDIDPMFGACNLIIDHYRLARHISWVKNFLAPRSAWPKSWKECQATGYVRTSPPG